MIQQIAFVMVLGIAGFILTRRITRIRNNIQLGKKTTINDKPQERLKNLLLVAFGQKIMFKRPIPAVLHLFIYVGFIVINLEVLEFVIDGLAGTHRIFARPFGPFYSVLMNIFELLAVAVLLTCVIFLVRRNIIKVKR